MKAARVAALGAAILFGASVSATAQPPVRGAERVATGDSVRHRGMRHGEGRQFGRALLKGVTLTDAKGNVAKVTTADLKASNGVIHVVDKVLMP